jgi:hypothetical protein
MRDAIEHITALLAEPFLASDDNRQTRRRANLE